MQMKRKEKIKRGNWIQSEQVKYLRTEKEPLNGRRFFLLREGQEQTSSTEVENIGVYSNNSPAFKNGRREAAAGFIISLPFF